MSSPSSPTSSAGRREEEKKAIYFWLKRIRAGHEFYSKATEAEKGRIISAFEANVFDNLNAVGLDTAFGMLYLLYGQEFLTFEFKVSSLEDYIASL